MTQVIDIIITSWLSHLCAEKIYSLRKTSHYTMISSYHSECRLVIREAQKSNQQCICERNAMLLLCTIYFPESLACIRRSVLQRKVLPHGHLDPHVFAIEGRAWTSIADGCLRANLGKQPATTQGAQGALGIWPSFTSYLPNGTNSHFPSDWIGG